MHRQVFIILPFLPALIAARYQPANQIYARDNLDDLNLYARDYDDLYARGYDDLLARDYDHVNVYARHNQDAAGLKRRVQPPGRCPKCHKKGPVGSKHEHQDYAGRKKTYILG